MKNILRITALPFSLLVSWTIVQAAGASELSPAPKGFNVARNDIAHGKLETIHYGSATLGISRPLVVYLPPDFTRGKKYPVLYLLHGSGDNETGWITKGSAAVILDNLYAARKLRPMIVVMPNGFAMKPGAPKPHGEKENGRNNALFEKELMHDIIPFVESHYPVRSDAEHRAIAGLSMGGHQALQIGLRHLDEFDWIGGFSAGMPEKQEELVHKAADDQNLRLLWLSCGDQDKQIAKIKPLHDLLAQQHAPHIWHIDSGKHEWPVWENDLYLFTPMLFR
jgi:enterochelin esterase-like enzyme